MYLEVLEYFKKFFENENPGKQKVKGAGLSGVL